MRLSEAMRLGAMIRPQNFFALAARRADLVRTCAWGAALEGAGRIVIDAYLALREHDEELQFDFAGAISIWSPFVDKLVVCPGCGCDAEIWSVIPCLNDRHCWTRERIAAWVEGIEAEVLGPAVEGAQQATIDAGAECLVCA